MKISVKNCLTICFLSVSLSLLILVLPAQAENPPVTKWTVNLKAQGLINRIFAMTIDSQNNVYVTGQAADTIAVLATIKLNSNGDILWRSVTPNNYECYALGGNKITVDSAGNVYVTGWATGCYKNGIRHNSDLIAVKYSPDGSILWMNRYSSAPADAWGFCSEDSSSDIDFNSSGNAILVGTSDPADGWRFCGQGGDITTIDYGSDGQLQWLRNKERLSNVYYSMGKLVKVGSEGLINVLGTYSSGDPRFGPYEQGWILIQYNPSGTLVKETVTPGLSGYPSALAEDNFGNLYVTGYSYDGANSSNIVIKYSNNGNLLWLANSLLWLDNSLSGLPISMTLSETGEYLYIASNKGTLSTILKYDADGNLVWTADYLGGNRPPVVKTNSFGDVYIGRGTYKYPFVGSMIIKYDKFGNMLWDIPAPGESFFDAIELGSNGLDIYIAQDHSVSKLGPVNNAPMVTANSPYSSYEGSTFILSASGNDPDGDPLTYAWDLDNDEIFETPGQSVSLTAVDGPGNYTVTVQVTDSGGLTAAAQATVTVMNVAPTVGVITAPIDPVSVTQIVNVSANFNDPGVLDTHTANWNWGDGTTSSGLVNETNGSGSVSDSHIFTTPGVYRLTLTVTDKDDASGESIFKYIVAYDSSAGFVTGGGWIDSPAGAYSPNTSLTGKANFGFVAKYKKGATVPDGQTEFQFSVANLNFHSSTYQWLVVAGATAKYKGTGTINGGGYYSFMLTATDGQLNGGGGVDKFRIKIWDNATGAVIYDNQMGASDDSNVGTALGGGSIIIHK